MGIWNRDPKRVLRGLCHRQVALRKAFSNQFIHSDGPSPNKEVKRSTSAISKKERGREKENFVEHGKDGRKEKSAPNRDISPGNIGKSGVIVE
jgi:hypothetical protein